MRLFKSIRLAYLDEAGENFKSEEVYEFIGRPDSPEIRSALQKLWGREVTVSIPSHGPSGRTYKSYKGLSVDPMTASGYFSNDTDRKFPNLTNPLAVFLVVDQKNKRAEYVINAKPTEDCKLVINVTNATIEKIKYDYNSEPMEKRAYLEDLDKDPDVQNAVENAGWILAKEPDRAGWLPGIEKAFADQNFRIKTNGSAYITQMSLSSNILKVDLHQGFFGPGAGDNYVHFNPSLRISFFYDKKEFNNVIKTKENLEKILAFVEKKLAHEESGLFEIKDILNDSI